ncbi:MAG: MFS transporter, partial [Anaerolineales bacterium]|nr:MFS transporter [Anaerolineales bacterium]
HPSILSPLHLLTASDLNAKHSSLIALSHRNFRLLWFGLLISMSGSLMRNAAILWHVSLLVPEDRKALALGVVGLVRVLPIIVFSFISGVVADAGDRRKVMLVTNSAMLAVSATLAALTLAGLDSLWAVYALAALGAAIGSFDGPARQALFPALVPREHLPNAISLNSLMFQTASVLGPMLGGLIIAAAGVAWAYVFDVCSFLFLLASLLLMRDVPQRPASERSEISLRAGWEGLKWVFGQPLIRSSMLLDFFATFFASATALLPIFAQDILRVGAQGYGLLVSAPALGAMLTSIAMVPLVERIEQRGRVLFAAVGVYGLATIVFGFSTSFWLTFACLFISGAADMVSTVLRNIIRQLHTPDGLRGRMTSVNMMFFLGGPQLGELEAGLVAQAFGPVVSVVSGGVGCLLATAWIAWHTPQLMAYRREQATLAATD